MCQGGGGGSPSMGAPDVPLPAAPDISSPSSWGSVAGPAKPANAMSWADRAKKFGKGFQAGMAGAQPFQQGPQGGGPNPIQSMSSPDVGMGPLADSILQKYFQNMGGQ